MATTKLSKELAQAALDDVTRHGGVVQRASESMRIPVSTLKSRLKAAANYGLDPSSGISDNSNPAHLRQQIKRLQADLRDASVKVLDAEMIKSRIVGLKHNVTDVEMPEWGANPRRDSRLPGVPTLFVSDLHWGEVVKPSQIMGKNSYNIAIAHERMQILFESAVHLLKIISPKMDYPGIVMPLGGDMISGNIHEELTATNELNSMPAVLDLYGVLVYGIGFMADTFGRVFLPCVTGNHGRDTMKIWNKDRHHTSFDWLLYCFLAKHFEGDKRVQFYIPDGPDALYAVYNHRYLLTHGDQFRGGDGMIGALGPLIRGDHKKRSRNAQIDLEYDTMICGHWHQYIHLLRLIVNGSLKGYDEYAYNGNFPFEPPQQALWLTHPKYRITYRMPVYVGKHREVPKTNWVKVAE